MNKTPEEYLQEAATFDKRAKETGSPHKMNIYMSLANKRRKLATKLARS